MVKFNIYFLPVYLCDKLEVKKIGLFSVCVGKVLLKQTCPFAFGCFLVVIAKFNICHRICMFYKA